jgi:hypothetical protein
MKCERVKRRLSAYIDGELSARAAMSTRRHLDSCPRCLEVAEQLRVVAQAARRLEDPALPPPDMFSRIVQELDADAIEGQRGQAPLLRWLALVGLPVAAVAAGAATVGLLWKSPEEKPSATPAAVAVRAGDTGLKTGAVRATGDEAALMDSVTEEFRRAEEHYRRAVAQLSRMARADSRRWAPSRRRSFEQSLRIIDDAIEQCRQVVRRNPLDPRRREVLFAAYRRQIHFLQDVIMDGPAVGDVAAAERAAGWP